MGEEALKRALRGTSVVVSIVGLFALGMGVFMIALHALELDPSAADITPIGMVLLYGFASVFILTGVAALYVGLIKSWARSRELVRIINQSPEQIARVYSQIFQSRGFEDAPGGSYWVYIELTNGKVHTVHVRKRNLGDVLSYVRKRAPHAV